MNEARDILLLEKFLAGTTTPDEEAWLRDWAETTLSQPGTLDLLRATWERQKTTDSLFDREQRWSALQGKIATAAQQVTRERHPDRHSSIRTARLPMNVWAHRIPMAVRATCGIVVLAGVAWFASDRFSIQDVSPKENANSRAYVTGRGQRAIVQLPDGTTATLAPETQLRFAMSDATGARRIELNGEAFFAVESNSATPFVVHAGNTVTKVLGTGFGVRWYGNDPNVRVAVASGRVSVQTVESATKAHVTSAQDQKSSMPDTRSVVLSANEVVRVGTNGYMQAEHDVDLTSDLGWRTGLHVFRMVPAEIVAVELGRAYDLDIRFSDPELGRQLLTLSFATDRESVMLDIFSSAMLDVRTERQGRTVTISRIVR